MRSSRQSRPIITQESITSANFRKQLIEAAGKENGESLRHIISPGVALLANPTGSYRPSARQLKTLENIIPVLLAVIQKHQATINEGNNLAEKPEAQKVLEGYQAILDQHKSQATTEQTIDRSNRPSTAKETCLEILSECAEVFIECFIDCCYYSAITGETPGLTESLLLENSSDPALIGDTEIACTLWQSCTDCTSYIFEHLPSLSNCPDDSWDCIVTSCQKSAEAFECIAQLLPLFCQCLAGLLQGLANSGEGGVQCLLGSIVAAAVFIYMIATGQSLNEISDNGDDDYNDNFGRRLDSLEDKTHDSEHATYGMMVLCTIAVVGLLPNLLANAYHDYSNKPEKHWPARNVMSKWGTTLLIGPGAALMTAGAGYGPMSIGTWLIIFSKITNSGFKYFTGNINAIESFIPTCDQLNLLTENQTDDQIFDLLTTLGKQLHSHHKGAVEQCKPKEDASFKWLRNKVCRIYRDCFQATFVKPEVKALLPNTSEEAQTARTLLSDKTHLSKV